MELVKAGVCHRLGTWLISSQDGSQQSYLFLFREIPREKSIFVQKRLRKAPEATSKGPVKDRLWLAGMTADRSGSLHAWHRSKAGFAGILNLALNHEKATWLSKNGCRMCENSYVLKSPAHLEAAPAWPPHANVHHTF